MHGELHTSPGSFLQEARQQRYLSVEEVADQLRIRPVYLLAIEADAFDQLPGESYARGYLREYARLLGQDSAVVLQLYENWRKQANLPERQQPFQPLSFWQRHGPERWMLWLPPLVLMMGALFWTAFLQEPSPLPERVKAVPEAQLVRLAALNAPPEQTPRPVPLPAPGPSASSLEIIPVQPDYPALCPAQCPAPETALAWQAFCQEERER